MVIATTGRVSAAAPPLSLAHFGVSCARNDDKAFVWTGAFARPRRRRRLGAELRRTNTQKQPIIIPIHPRIHTRPSNVCALLCSPIYSCP